MCRGKSYQARHRFLGKLSLFTRSNVSGVTQSTTPTKERKPAIHAKGTSGKRKIRGGRGLFLARKLVCFDIGETAHLHKQYWFGDSSIWELIIFSPETKAWLCGPIVQDVAFSTWRGKETLFNNCVEIFHFAKGVRSLPHTQKWIPDGLNTQR